MQRGIVIGLVVWLGALAVWSPVAGARDVPTVRRKFAIYLTGRYSKERTSWPKRDSGSIDCNGGRVDRTHWKCKVKWQRGRYCWAMRVMVWGKGFEDGVPYYGVHGISTRRLC